MLPDVWNVDEPLEVEYRWPIHQNSDQSNNGRKEIVKPPCADCLSWVFLLFFFLLCTISDVVVIKLVTILMILCKAE